MEEKAKKAVIYIDVEDEITDVVNKIKEAQEKIIALVPPKGIGILRSAVNLRILERTSKKAGKQIVLISGNSALVSMAGAASIPVAKTLQSKPEIPEIDALEIDGEDIIDGEKLPVAEFAKKAEDDEAEMLSNLDIDDNKTFSNKEPVAAKNAKNKAAKGFKIPDFNAFRKKIFLFGGLGAVLLIFLVWAIFFAPAAKVVISAKTSNLNLSETVKLVANNASVDAEKGILPVLTQTLDKNSELSFDTTGTKEEGEAASGTLTLSQSSEGDPMAIKSGTAFSAGDCNFVTTQTATIPGAKVSGGAIRPGTTTVEIRATQIGEQCNLAAQTYVSSVSGVSARGGQTSGGTKTVKKIVSQADANSAQEKLSTAQDLEAIRTELTGKFNNDYYVLKDSFKSEPSDVKFSPAVNAEAPDGKAKASATVKYSLVAIKKTDLKNYLEAVAKEKLNKNDSQKVYNSGFDSVKMSNYGGESVKITTTAKVGPKIDEKALKEKIHGKRYSEVQSIAKETDGVSDVDVQFSYFWVSTVPANNDKIDIEFTVK